MVTFGEKIGNKFEMVWCDLLHNYLEYYGPRKKAFRPLTSQVVQNWQVGVMEIRDPGLHSGDAGDSDDKGPAPASRWAPVLGIRS